MSLTKEAKPTAEEIRRKVARYKKLLVENVQNVQNVETVYDYNDLNEQSDTTA